MKCKNVNKPIKFLFRNYPISMFLEKRITIAINQINNCMLRYGKKNKIESQFNRIENKRVAPVRQKLDGGMGQYSNMGVCELITLVRRLKRLRYSLLSNMKTYAFII